MPIMEYVDVDLIMDIRDIFGNRTGSIDGFGGFQIEPARIRVSGFLTEESIFPTLPPWEKRLPKKFSMPTRRTGPLAKPGS
jgi:hypothetical protein